MEAHGGPTGSEEAKRGKKGLSRLTPVALQPEADRAGNRLRRAP